MHGCEYTTARGDPALSQVGSVAVSLSGSVYSYRRGLWVLKNTRKSVVRDLDIRSCKQLKIRQESVKMES